MTDMNILFISSGNSGGGISPLVRSQGESLKKAGLNVDYFTITGGGLKGYLKAIPKLRKVLKHTEYDLLHAHYGLSGLTAFFGKRGLPLVVSYMGDDLMGSKKQDGSVKLFSRLLVCINRFMARFFYDAVIVKSEEMKERLGLSSGINDKNTVNLEDRQSPPLEGGDLGVVENESQSNGIEIDFKNGSKIINEEKNSPHFQGGVEKGTFSKREKGSRKRERLTTTPNPSLRRRGAFHARLKIKPKIYVIPNGVNLDRFFPIEKDVARRELGVSKDEILVLFVSDPARPEKNYPLAERAVQLQGNEKVQLQAVYGEPQEKINLWMNAADLLVLTSFHEGSPNVVKEAMACNCPVVSTDVGDVKEVFGKTEGYFISGYEPEEFANQILKAIHYNRKHGRTNGRERILELGLDEGRIAKRILAVYKQVLKT